ncbi:hypothetical protein [uncultured Sulfitobacter sp.]|uniref:hypothetical protein n=1 Tax=uncultured Sulfitobacter sp. TaxID=191468 RepID=UPI0026287D5B|nr:hypothetical protein [uncultured Sulfitobacter sp.]
MAERIEVTVEEAEADFERLLKLALQGEQVVILREDGFCVQLVPNIKDKNG